MPELVERLRLKCCGEWWGGKDACTWAPCPANMDCYSPEELRAFMDQDPHRVDDAIAIWLMPPEGRS